ncbi:MAG: TonB family protein [Sphingomonas sp.]|nr:TonB family protein [Sphingomonas sp.]RZV52689.1 MAG: TonB family protein [Sphingomonadaceae bacterium]
MAYGEQTPPAQRVGTLLIVLLLHGAVAAVALLFGSVGGNEVARDPPLDTFDIALPEPPPPEVDIDEPDQATPREEGAASEENIESEATPVEATVVRTPTRNPTPASQTPNQGRDTTQGASDRPGEGTGAGGRGDGTGAGNSGTGMGGGGGTRPSVVQGTTLTARDYPRDMRRRWPSGGRVLVAVRVQVNGRATDCRVNVSIGDPEIDAETCRLVEQKVRFNPARNARGQPYVAWYGYMQYNPG